MDRNSIEKEHFAAANLMQKPMTSHKPSSSSYSIADKNEEEEHKMPAPPNIDTTDLIQQPVDKLNSKTLSNNAMHEDGGGKSDKFSSNTPIKRLNFNYEDLEDESEDSEDEEYREVSSAEDESEEEVKLRHRQRRGSHRMSVPSKKRGATAQSRRKSSTSGPPAKRSRHSYKSHMEQDDETDQSEEDFSSDNNSDDEEGGGEYVPRGTSSRPRV